MDAFAEPAVHTVVVMSSAQVGKTEIINNVIGYHVDQDPAPILLIQPTLEMAEAWSKDRLAPMVRDTPALRGRIADPRSRDSGNTLLHKKFAGGHITMSGANSPSSLASRPIRIFLGDEVDRFPVSAGTEGDPVSLGRKRTATFWNRKIGLFSTPTIKNASRIEMAWEESDQRRYYVPCPHCNEFQALKWSGVHWDKDRPESAYYVCEHCGAVITEGDKPRMLRRGQWIAERAERYGVAGFHLNELYSPWRRWAEVAADFLSAKRSPETLKTWVNTSLGESWEESAERADPDSLLARRENYGPDSLPSEILLLTAGVDVQDDRLELEVVGWRSGSIEEPPESWGVEDKIFYGDPAQPQVWADLDEALKRAYQTQDGRTLRVVAAGIDSGGHHTAQVYRFCQARIGRRVYAVKGMSGAKPIWPKRAGKSRKHGGALVWGVGVDSAKDAIYSRLRIREPGPGYCHFPSEYDQEWFKQLTVERVRTKYIKGHPVREWIKPDGARNEALDKRVYALAALESLQPINWGKIARQAERSTAEADDSEQAPPSPPPDEIEAVTVHHQKRVRRRPKRGGGFVTGWRK